MACGAAAAACVAKRCCHRPCRTADPPRAVMQPLLVSSHHRHVRAYPLHLYAATGLVRGHHCHAHVAELVVALSFMALRPRAMSIRDARACSKCLARASMIMSTTSHQGETKMSPLVALSLSLLPPSSHAINWPPSDHLHSIQCIHVFTIRCSRCPTPPSHEEGTTKLQFWSFPAAVPIRLRPAVDVGSPPTIPLELIHLHH